MITVAVSATKLEVIRPALEAEPELQVVSIPREGPLDALPGCEVLLHWGLSLPRFEECADGLKGVQWVHTYWAGTERILPIASRFPGPPRFSDARGAYEIPMAEHTVGLLLGLVRGLHRRRDDQSRAHWNPTQTDELHGKRALILGAGSIGARVGRLLQAFGVEVRGIRRRRSIDVGFPLLDPSKLDEWLPKSDVLIAALPETPETMQLLHRDRIDALPQGAYLINVGRGSLLDADRLKERLESGALAGAALDVFPEEPLPAESPLWSCPDLWISPHCSGLSPAMDARRLDLFLRNLRAFRAGEPLVNEATS